MEEQNSTEELDQEQEPFVRRPQINIASDTLAKGEVRKGKQLVAWDCIQECHPDRCPIGHTCTYLSANVDGRCSLQQQYLQSFVDTIFSTYRYLDEADMFRVGMHLVPLYSQLCRQKIVEKSVGSLSYEDAKGITRIHPIYKEIRETLKCITVIWKEMGFTTTPNPALPKPGESAIMVASGKSGFGDPEHYNRLIQNADSKRNVVR